MGVGVAERSRVDPRACGLQVDLADEVGGGFGLRELEVLALARRLAFGERREHADGQEPAGDVIGVVHRRAARIRRVGVVPEQVHAAEARVERSVGGHLAERAAAPVALRRHVDDARVGRAHGVVAEASSFERAAPLVLGDDVGRRAQGERELTPAFGVEVERDAAPTAALVVEGEALVDELDAAAAHAQHVEVGPRLDLDHVGAQLREDRAHLGHHRGDAELDHPHAVEEQVAPACRGRAGDEAGANVGVSSTDAPRRIDEGVRASLTGCVANGRPSRPSHAGFGEELARAGLRVRDELARLVEHAHRGAVAERFGEQLGAACGR